MERRLIGAPTSVSIAPLHSPAMSDTTTESESDDAASPAFNLNDQEYELVDVEAIEPHPQNPRRGDMRAIGESMDENDFFGAVLVQRATADHGTRILQGEHRWRVAKSRGATEVPVVWITCDDDRAARIMLADNKTADSASYAQDALAELLREMDQAESGLAGTGWTDAEFDAILESLNVPDLEPGEGKAPPGEFPEFGDDISTDFRCPKCGYEWSGQQAP